VKGDVQGSVEAITAALEKLGNEEVSARILHSGVGGITESDVTLATASGALLIGFNIRAHKEAREAADRAGVEIRYYNIIYNLVDDVKEALSGLLPPNLREERLGEAQVLEVFDVSKVGKVAGCRVLEGRVERGAHVRLVRDNVGHLRGPPIDPQALQGRRQGSRGRPGMRHVVRQLRQGAPGRLRRVLPRPRREAHALILPAGGGVRR
jgi:translation initiation factor IF-2